MSVKEEPTHPLFLYLDAEDNLLPGKDTLSRREMIRLAYGDLAPDDKPLFQRALCSRVGDTVRALRERTRLMEIAPIVHPDRQTRRLVRRQIVDDVRDLLRSSTVPTGDAALDYVKRLRCLGEIGAIESSRFWQLAYELCGSSCSLVVFTELYKKEPRVAMRWLRVNLSRPEQVRVLEKTLPAIIEENATSATEVEAFLQAAGAATPPVRPQGREWSDVLQSLIRGELHQEADRGGPMEYLRSTAIDQVNPQIVRDEIHIRIAVDQLFSQWASSAIVLPLASALRLLTLAREFRSISVLSSLIRHLESLSVRVPEAYTEESADAREIGIAILDSLVWFDETMDGLNRSFGDPNEEAPHSELPSRLCGILRVIRQRGEWSGRADRELVRHSLSQEDQALALVSIITGEFNVEDWLEELDRRLGSENFQAIAQLVLTRYRIQSHLKPRLAFLGEWCEDAYTTRDRLVPGSGWPLYPIKGSLLESISEVRDNAELDNLLAAFL